MLDPILLRERPEDVRAGLAHRGVDLGERLDTLVRLDTSRREILPVLENARRQRKELGGKIAQAKREGLPVEELLEAGQQYAEQIKEQEEKLDKVEAERDVLSLMLPNLAHKSVPVGVSETDNQEVRRVAIPRRSTSRSSRIGTSDPSSGFWTSSGPLG